MTALIHAEMLKLRSTRVTLYLLIGPEMDLEGKLPSVPAARSSPRGAGSQRLPASPSVTGETSAR